MNATTPVLKPEISDHTKLGSVPLNPYYIYVHDALEIDRAGDGVILSVAVQ